MVLWTVPMNYKTFLVTAAMIAGSFAPVAYAQSLPVAPVDTTTPVLVASVVSDALTPEQAMQAELADLQVKEADPATGMFAKFFIHLRIRQLENQLNIKKALG